VTNFVNLKIKSAQSFRGAHMSRMCVYVFIGVSDRMCMSIYVCTVFLKKVGLGKCEGDCLVKSTLLEGTFF
jgi:hypothetical protein